jgi:hypothetical protein
MSIDADLPTAASTSLAIRCDQRSLRFLLVPPEVKQKYGFLRSSKRFRVIAEGLVQTSWRMAWDIACQVELKSMPEKRLAERSGHQGEGNGRNGA